MTGPNLIRLLLFAGVLLFSFDTGSRSWAGDTTQPNSHTERAARSETQDSSATRSYQSQLDRLDSKSPDSITMALEAYKQAFAKGGTDLREKGFIAFRTFMQKTIDIQDDIAQSKGWPMASIMGQTVECSRTTGALELDYSLRKIPRLNALFRNGMDIYTSEGDYFLEERPGFVYRKLHQFTSPSVSEFLRIRDREMREGFGDDAMLIIPLANVAERVATWDAYLARFPRSALIEDANWFRWRYFSVLMDGMDNTPVLDEQNRVQKDTLDVYEAFIRQNPKTESSRILRAYIRLLSQPNITQDAVQAFLTKNLGEIVCNHEMCFR